VAADKASSSARVETVDLPQPKGEEVKVSRQPAHRRGLALIYCIECGVSLPPQAHFCSECGTTVNRSAITMVRGSHVGTKAGTAPDTRPSRLPGAQQGPTATNQAAGPALPLPQRLALGLLALGGSIAVLTGAFLPWVKSDTVGGTLVSRSGLDEGEQFLIVVGVLAALGSLFFLFTGIGTLGGW